MFLKYFRWTGLRFRIRFQRFPEVVFDLFHQRSRFEHLRERAKAHDPGLYLFGSGHFEREFQGAVLELFILLARMPTAFEEIAGQGLVETDFDSDQLLRDMPKLWRR